MKKSFLLIIVLTLLCASCQKKTSHNVKPTENTDVINPTSFDVKVSHLFTNYDEDTHEYKYMYDKMLGHKRGLILGFPKNSGSFRFISFDPQYATLVLEQVRDRLFKLSIQSRYPIKQIVYIDYNLLLSEPQMMKKNEYFYETLIEISTEKPISHSLLIYHLNKKDLQIKNIGDDLIFNGQFVWKQNEIIPLNRLT